MKMNYKCITLISTGLLLLTNNSFAGEWYHQTTFSSRVEGDSNKRLRTDDEKGVAGVNARIDINLSNVTEISEVYVRGALSSVRYDGDDDRGVDSDDQLLYAGGTWTGERSQLTVDGEFLRRSSLVTELQDSGFLEDVDRREDKGLTSQFSYAVFENTQVFIGGSYTQVDFPNSVPVSLTEYTVEGINGGILHNFDERHSATLTLYHSDYEAETFSSDVETNGADIRFNKQFNEIWSGFAGYGYRKSNFRNEVDTPFGVFVVREDETGSSYQFGASRETELSNFDIELSNTLQPSADGDVNERTDLSLAYRRAISSRLSTRVDFDWFEDEAINNRQEADREYWTLTVGSDYRITPHWYLTGRYRHREQDIDGATSSSNADSDAVIIGVRYSGNRKRL